MENGLHISPTNVSARVFMLALTAWHQCSSPLQCYEALHVKPSLKQAAEEPSIGCQ